MLERSGWDATVVADKTMMWRRLLFTLAVAATMAIEVSLAAIALSPRGLSAVDLVILVLFVITMPWLVIGFWNAMIGFLIMRFAKDPDVAACPPAARIRGNEPITSSVAILLCIRNEGPDRIIRNLEPMMNGLVAAGVAKSFHLYILSDTSDAKIAAAEEARFNALTTQWRNLAITYRRRTTNTGFKAGNIRDFCERWGNQHKLAVTLDADSFMTAEAVLHLVRIMQANPKIGILQGLVVGLPSTSAFARIFQFGMRLGMRSYTIGSAWWQGDCGPYWGHNAVIRLAPFISACVLPTSALGGEILSHDQIEAVLMRRAGFEVRVVTNDELGWEENPPTLIEFIRRDLRWCQGNMQYWPFLLMPGLKPVSRYQLAFAILMFLGSPAWIGLLILVSISVALVDTPAQFMRADAGIAVFVVVLITWFAPKITTVADSLMRSRARRAFGGTLRFLAGVVTESIFFLLLLPIMWFSHTWFLIKLPFGGGIGWIGQTRDDHSVSIWQATRTFWPHTVLGAAVIGLLAVTHPAVIPYTLFIAGGLLASIPLTVLSASPRLGNALVRIGLGRLPEETAPLPALRKLAVPAIEMSALPASRAR